MDNFYLDTAGVDELFVSNKDIKEVVEIYEKFYRTWTTIAERLFQNRQHHHYPSSKVTYSKVANTKGVLNKCLGRNFFEIFEKGKTDALSFYRSQNVFCRSKFFEPAKNLTAFSASSKTFVLAQKPILLNANHLLVWHKMFVTSTIL